MNITTLPPEQQAALQAYIQETSDFNAFVTVTLASTVLLAYDILSTLPLELELMSLRRLSAASVLYYCARYPSLFTLAIQCSTLFLPLNTSPQIAACNIIYVLASVISLFSIIGIQGILAARTYTICNCNKLVLLVFVSLLCIGLGLSLGDIIVAPLCIPSTSQAVLASKLSSFQLLSIIISDTIVFAFITFKVLRHPGLSRKTCFETFPLYRVLLEQGVIRYCFVLAISLTAFVLHKTVWSTLTGILIPMQESLSTIVIYRLSLDLRSQNLREQVEDETALATVSFRHPITAVRVFCKTIVTEFGSETNIGSFTGNTIPYTNTIQDGYGTSVTGLGAPDQKVSEKVFERMIIL